jgi:hypothetical protein
MEYKMSERDKLNISNNSSQGIIIYRGNKLCKKTWRYRKTKIRKCN